MKNENNKTERANRLLALTKNDLVFLAIEKDDEILRLNNILSDLEAQRTAVPVENKGDVSHILEVQKLHELIDTLQHGNQKLINTVAYQAMQLAGELKL